MDVEDTTKRGHGGWSRMEGEEDDREIGERRRDGEKGTRAAKQQQSNPSEVCGQDGILESEQVVASKLRNPPYPGFQLYAVWKGPEEAEEVDTSEPKAGRGKQAAMLMRMAMRKTMIRVAERTFFDAVVLCVWTDVLGPRCRHVWLGSKLPKDSFNDKLLGVLPRLTTSGELTRDLEADGTCASRYYRLPSEGFELGTFVFLANVDGAQCRCALSLVKELPPEGELSRYLKLFQVCRERMATLVKKLVASLKHAKESMARVLLRFTDDLGPFMIAVNQLGHPGGLGMLNASKPSPFADTVLDVSAVPEVHDIDEDTDGLFQVDRPFLDICITCHLQTAGRSVIVGPDEPLVRKLLRTLALFLAPAEQETVRYDFGDRLYEPDLVLQAVAPTVPDLESQVLDANNPSTIIDMQTRVVRRTHNRDVYTVEHERREHAQLSSIESGKQTRLPSSKLPATRRAAPLVRQLLDTLLVEPPSCHAALLTHFLRSLQRTALVLIELANGCRATSERPLPAQKREKMRQALGLDNYHDFEVVLAMCWKLDNESYARILGDDSVREDQLSSFLGSL